jgi:hypothetical protein
MQQQYQLEVLHGAPASCALHCAPGRTSYCSSSCAPTKKRCRSCSSTTLAEIVKQKAVENLCAQVRGATAAAGAAPLLLHIVDTLAVLASAIMQPPVDLKDISLDDEAVLAAGNSRPSPFINTPPILNREAEQQLQLQQQQQQQQQQVQQRRRPPDGVAPNDDVSYNVICKVRCKIAMCATSYCACFEQSVSAVGSCKCCSARGSYLLSA